MELVTLGVFAKKKGWFSKVTKLLKRCREDLNRDLLQQKVLMLKKESIKKGKVQDGSQLQSIRSIGSEDKKRSFKEVEMPDGCEQKVMSVYTRTNIS
ncbi:unnamed protein product [marine sediment metagenome]|uniref:Uncharacterized protein n=1 Tax=marine sediment metagenome TaxID=412755 RepID=X0W525_9ZZZZ